MFTTEYKTYDITFDPSDKNPLPYAVLSTGNSFKTMKEAKADINAAHFKKVTYEPITLLDGWTYGSPKRITIVSVDQSGNAYYKDNKATKRMTRHHAEDLALITPENLAKFEAVKKNQKDIDRLERENDRIEKSVKCWNGRLKEVA